MKHYLFQLVWNSRSRLRFWYSKDLPPLTDDFKKLRSVIREKMTIKTLIKIARTLHGRFPSWIEHEILVRIELHPSM